MIALRLARVVGHLLLGLAICAFVFPFAGPGRRRRRVRHWSRGLLRLCDVQLSLQDAQGIPLDELPDGQALVVANHVSWLDIFVINAALPCRFVAKADIRHWPLIGWLCARSGTIFMARDQKSAVRTTYRHIVGSLQSGQRIAFFPEGTTAAQGRILPFHANLFEAAVEAGVPVQAYALRYLTPEGALHPAVDFTGDTSFAESMVGILRTRRVLARLTLLPLLPSQGKQRRELAAQAYELVAEALGQAPWPTETPCQEDLAGSERRIAS